MTLNLLPRPRVVEEGGRTVADTEPVVRAGASLPAQGYDLSIAADGVRIDAADDAGAFYARATLDQLRRLHAGSLPVCRIRDWPDVAVRGVMLDIARDKVPTMATLEALIDRLASWKLNQVQLYMEHTFAYQAHREVWAEASPFTADEVRHLDAFCRERHVELVPNQNCLGHMERWLKHPRYRPLAMSPDGFVNQRGMLRPPTTIEPSNPASLALVRELLSELLRNFGSRRVHVGLDEPWELPDQRFGEYLGWVRTLRGLDELDGHEMLVWGDILAMHPELLGELPDRVTVCEWGYEDWHPFDQRTAALAAAGRPFWVAPGTSSWLTILGRVTNMVGNNVVAVEAALANGGAGFLTTDWGDMGHLQYLPVSEPGFAFGAAASWCLEANRALDLAAALDAHSFADDAGELGAALVELGNSYRGITPQFPNVSALVMHLYFPQFRVGTGFTEGLTVDELLGVEEVLERATSRLDRAAPGRADGSLVLDELRNGAALVALMCRDARARLATEDGRLRSVPDADRRRLAIELAPIVDRHRDLWLARNRPGGLDDSLAWLENLRTCYETGVTDREWGGW